MLASAMNERRAMMQGQEADDGDEEIEKNIEASARAHQRKALDMDLFSPPPADMPKTSVDKLRVMEAGMHHPSVVCHVSSEWQPNGRKEQAKLFAGRCKQIQ